MPFSTGLYAIFDNLPVYIYAGTSGINCVGINECLNIDTITKLQVSKGEPGWGISLCGCLPEDGIRVFNCCIYAIIRYFGCGPCVLAYWRCQLREEYSVDGSYLGDCLLYCCCCGVCAQMQEAREIRIRLSAPDAHQMDIKEER